MTDKPLTKAEKQQAAEEAETRKARISRATAVEGARPDTQAAKDAVVSRASRDALALLETIDGFTSRKSDTAALREMLREHLETIHHTVNGSGLGLSCES